MGSKRLLLGSQGDPGGILGRSQEVTVSSKASQGIPRSSQWVPKGSKGVSVQSERLQKVPGGSQWGPEESRGGP